MTTVIALPERMDISSCKGLLPQLVASRGKDVELDGSAVCHVGAIGAQFLISAKESWANEKAALAVTGLSETAEKCLVGLGIALDQVGASSEGGTS